MDQGRPKVVNKNSSCALHLFLNPIPTCLLRILTFWALKGPVQNESKSTSFRSVRETLTETGNAIPYPHHLPKLSLAINNSIIQKAAVYWSSLGWIKIAGLMLWKVTIDDGDMFSKQLSFKSPVPPAFPTELNNSEGHTWSGSFQCQYFSLVFVCINQSEAERRVGEIRRDGRIPLRYACQDLKGIAFLSLAWYENKTSNQKLLFILISVQLKAPCIQFLSWNKSWS